VHLRRIDSTNALARELALQGAPHGTLVSATEQLAGRGRQGRSWIAPAGASLLCSWVIREPSPLLSLVAGAAVAEVCGEAAMIKWPNDVLIDARKVAGILVEGRPQQGWAVLGIGINVALTPRDLPQDLREIAGSLGLTAADVEPTLLRLEAALERWLARPGADVLTEVRARDALLGQTVSWAEGAGTAAGIDEEGRLRVRRTDGGEALLDAGEVHLGSAATAPVSPPGVPTGSLSPASVTAVVVAHGGVDELALTLDALRQQTRWLQEIIVVDNHAEQPAAAALSTAQALTVIANPANTGYGGGNALGAARARSDYLLFINPDAQPAPDLCARLASELDEDDAVAIVGAQILLPDGRCNAGENPLHFTGLSWSGRYGSPAQNGDAREALAVSGACMMVRAAYFRELDGFSLPYFLYCEDTDLCWRARLRGWRVRFVPRATVVHEYEFNQGQAKWRYLERNRLLMVLANYEARTILLALPALFFTEAGLWVVACRDGWAMEKGRSYADIFRLRYWLRRQRAKVQSQREVADEVLLQEMAGRLDSSPLMSGPTARLLSGAYARYRLFLLRTLARSPHGGRPQQNVSNRRDNVL
jgi:BirA family biotin operon repressor/biotin-[acetyl-CoA-carboxylase] ligase